MSSRRLRNAFVRLAVPALLLAAVAQPAEAQACTTGTLADYMTMATPCRLGGWDFFDFFLISSAAANGPTTATAPQLDGSDVFVTPFLQTGPGNGTLTFGFFLDGFAVEATATGGDLGAGTASAFALFGFQAVRATGQPMYGAGADIFISGATNTPGRTELYQNAIVGAFDPISTETCLERFVENFGNGSKVREPRQLCGTPSPDQVIGVYGIEADADRSDSRRAEDGFSHAEITAVGFRTVPEPATVALVAGGLLTLAGVARRRRDA